MNVPRFSAEASLHQTTTAYKDLLPSSNGCQNSVWPQVVRPDERTCYLLCRGMGHQPLYCLQRCGDPLVSPPILPNIWPIPGTT